MLTITRAEALYALAVAPFVAVCLIAIVAAVAYVSGVEHQRRLWSDRTEVHRQRLQREAAETRRRIR